MRLSCKNAAHSVAIEPTNSVFPNLIFIILHRYPVHNIRSLIRTREELDRSGRFGDWISAKLRGWQNYRNEHYVVQSCAQVCLIQQNMSSDIQAIPGGRLFRICYTGLCHGSGRTIDGIAEFVRGQEFALEAHMPIPDTFPFSLGPKLLETYEKLIESALEQFS